MSRRSPSAADIPRLLDELSSGDAREAVKVAEALEALAFASQAGALRLARADALPPLVQAFRSPDATVASHAGTALCAMATAAPDLVADAASSALVAVLRGEDTVAGAAAARVRAALAMQRRWNGWRDMVEAMSQTRHTHSQFSKTQVFNAIAGCNPARLAAEPGALQALCSALCRTTRATVDSAASALDACARGSPGVARLVADTPGLLAAMVGVIASSQTSDAARHAVFTLYEVAAAGADLAARIVSTPGAVPALSQTMAQCSDGRVAECAAGVFTEAARAGPQHADAIAAPDVLAALVSAAGRAGMGMACMAAFAEISSASQPLALRVADTPGAEAAMLAALTCSDLKAAINATIVFNNIARADGECAARLLSAQAVPLALVGLLQSDDAAAVGSCTHQN
jgi:hypothetical protein